ncbi:membrane protein [Tersicoccus solisilvae]|uniref:Membrane protein n=1 Tax=Tersicoccus solisilvae TaxID=1882339 RepID=A0ABQ1P0I4_9MICC|nr:membrane protein [Tersicoccus solisilvae]
MTQNHTEGRGSHRRSGNPDVHTITDAQQSHTADMNGRMIRYATSMGIRLVCIVLAFVFDGWLRWVMIAGAVILPWIAVVIANAGGTVDVSNGNPSTETTPPRPALTRGPTADDEVLDGEVLDDDDATPDAPRERDAPREPDGRVEPDAPDDRRSGPA